MKKKILYISFILLMFLLLIPNSKALADTSSSGGYNITSYSIVMNVNEDNTYNITEDINVNFTSERHGIYRKIPLTNKIERQDGSRSTIRAKISDVDINDTYSSSIEDGYKVFKIGNAASTITGHHEYIIKYTYSVGKDKLKDADELYFNLIGNNWDVSISNATFAITMPKEFNKSSLGFSSGKYGSTDSSNISYTVIGNTISGYTSHVLGAGEGITVRLTLPDGYFSKANSFDPTILLPIIIPILFAIISFILWYKYGRDIKPVETVEFYPPEGFNSVEIGYIYKGKVADKDIISLLIYLANKGYLKISEVDTKVLFVTSKSFQFTKLKNYDGSNENERVFLDGLFSSSDVVTSSDLQDKFYLTMNKIKTNFSSKKNEETIFEKSSLTKRLVVLLMIFITLIMLVVSSSVITGETEGVAFLVISSIATFFFIFFTTWKISLTPTTKAFIFIWGFCFVGIPLLGTILPSLLIDSSLIVVAIVNLICIVLMSIFYALLPKRTPYGTELLGKIKGFRRFLLTAEKEQLEAQVSQNPTYFYDILPYTYVLGVSDKWIKQFESIALQSPNWYDSPNAFDYIYFTSFMNSTMNNATSVASAPSSSGSDGGFSGGGFSGGGSGGGGGGSW